MPESTVYTQDTLESCISALKAAHKDLAGMLEELKSQLDTSLDKWETNARHTYQSVQEEWDRSLQRQNEIIESMPALLSNTAESYDAAKEGNTRRWS